MGTTLDPKKLRKTFVNIISQNVRGFSDEKEEEIIDCMGKHKIWAACLQETWRTTKASWENNGYTFLHAKETPNLSRRAIWDELRYGAAQPL